MGEPFQLGRYALHAELAAGGMAVVYLGRQTGPVGFGKTVAIKRLHPHLAKDPYFAAMFLDEARLAARVQHPNVVPILDVVSTESELFLVLEYIRGETLSGLLRAARKRKELVPVPIAAAIVVGLLAGLHAAHEARDETGKPLSIVHRDVSPQNLIVGADGVPRVLDFGVAKAATRLQTTREGQLKGKIPYMSPEQLNGEVTAKSDVYSAALVFWEALTSQRLFRGETEAQVLHHVLTLEAPAPSTLNPSVPAALDAIVLKGLARDPAARYATAREMAAAIEACTPVASAMKIAEWVEALIGPTLVARDTMRAEIESGAHSVNSVAPISTPSLPPFPRVSEPSSVTGSQPVGGINESMASLVVGAERAPPKSRVPIVLAGVGAVLVVAAAVAVGFAVRGGPKPEPTLVNAASAAPTVPAATSVAPPAPSPPAVSESAAVVAPPVATHHKIVRSSSSGTAHRNPNDIDSLLDTR